ncbi:hypothetical protein LJR194_005112 [Acidovorax sp. LjRoot194]
MGLILLEALLALVLLGAIVWWTMFSGRKGGELKPPGQDTSAPAPAPSEAPGPKPPAPPPGSS